MVVSGARRRGRSLVGQIAKIKGCRVVGIAGGARKCAYVTDELGLDAAVDYKGGRLAEALAAACPKGIDIYFENVGGEVFDAVLPLFNNFARVPVCGHVAEYNVVAPRIGPDKIPALMLAVLGKRLTLRGFVVSDFMAEMEISCATWAPGSPPARSIIASTSPRGSRTHPAPFSACCGRRISASRWCASRPIPRPERGPQARRACASLMRRHRRGGESGSARGSTPSEASAAATALAMTPPTGMMPPSPAPLAPSGLMRRRLVLERDGADATGNRSPSA